MILAAFTHTCSITLLAYCVSNGNLQAHVFKSSYAASLTYLQFAFINRHYDLVTDELDESGYEVSAGTNHQVIEIIG